MVGVETADEIDLADRAVCSGLGRAGVLRPEPRPAAFDTSTETCEAMRNAISAELSMMRDGADRRLRWQDGSCDACTPSHHLKTTLPGSVTSVSRRFHRALQAHLKHGLPT